MEEVGGEGGKHNRCKEVDAPVDDQHNEWEVILSDDEGEEKEQEEEHMFELNQL